MQLRVLKLSLFVILLCSVNARRLSSTRGTSTRGGSWKSPPKTQTWTPKSSPPIHRPAPPVFKPPTSGQSHGTTSSRDFLLHESQNHNHHQPTAPILQKPNPIITHSAPSTSHTSHNPSPYPTNNKPVIHDTHQQIHTGTVHSDPNYPRQPATNPNFPYPLSGGHNSHSGGVNIPTAPHGISLPTSINNGHGSSSVPYPTGHPNHPQPHTNFGSSSYPTNSHIPIQPHTHSNPVNNVPHIYGSPPPYQQHAPPYQPATTAFVPGKTVYVLNDSGHRSKGPGIGSIVAGGIAGGVAAGATNAIVDHAISAIFRPSAYHTHTYPSAPPVGTPTSTVTYTTNNYYNAPGSDNNGGAPSSSNYDNNYNNNGPQSQVVGQPAQGQSSSGQSGPQYSNISPSNSQPSYSGNPSVGVTTGAANDGIADPPVNRNGFSSRTPDGQPAATVDPNFISDENIMKLTEELFDKQETNFGQYIDQLNLQKRVTNTGQETVPDEAPEPLFKIKPELYDQPTVKTLKALYDNYQRDGTQKEIMNDERRNEESDFVKEIAKTPVMARALSWLVDRKIVESDNFEQKDLLRRMWFSNFDETSSGFERIFLSEKFGDSGIVGMQNWIYFAHLEGQNNVDYLGYVDQLNLSGKGLLLKLNYKTEGFTVQNATIFVGTSPELELALYTVCFHARPNNWCPVSLGGAKFFVLTHSFRSYGKDLIDLAFPAF